MRRVTIFIALLVWSFVVLASIWVQRSQLDRTVEALARNDAMANLRKDMAIRKWASSLGGVFVNEARVPNIQSLTDQERIHSSRSTGEAINLVLLTPIHILLGVQETNAKEYGVKERLTSLQLRNRDNLPDDWEANALKALADGAPMASEVMHGKGGHGLMRVMIPMRMENECLECHRDTLVPVGGLRGGAAIAVNLDTYREAQEPAWRALQAGHFGAWLLGVLTIFSFGWAARRRQQERGKSEEIRRENDLAFSAMAEGAIITDADGFILWANQAFSNISGFSHDEVIGKKPSILKSGRHSDAEYAALWQQLKTVGEWRGELWNRRKNGEVFPQGISIRALRANNGQISRFISIVSDITERKQSEEALRIAATAFESQQGMAITNAQRVILQVNQAFTQITGYSAEESVGQTPRILSSGRHDSAYYDAMRQSLEVTGAWAGEIWNRRKTGEVYPEWLTISAVNDSTGLTTHYVAIFSDITAKKETESQINNLAFYDPLTQLPNRRLLLDRLKHALASSMRSKKYGAILFIDLDNFKTLNDTLGHHIGDLLLQQVAQRLRTCVREGDTVARLGGDEFVLMLEDLSDDIQESATQCETVGEKILAVLNQPYQLASYAYHSTPSIGITLFTDYQESVDELLKRADLAMYQAKASGRNTLRFFDPEMQAAVTARAALEADLGQAVLNGQFLLYYQAQVNGEGLVTGVEALVRWLHPERGLVSPAEFIPLAEDTGLILPIGLWVLETACLQLASWATNPEMAQLTVAVNVSANQVHQDEFVDQVLSVLDRTGALPQRLKLELTESLLVNDLDAVIAKMMALKAKGVGFSLDDFGTGYSSLSYLKRLPLDQLKIDQGFVRDILIDSNDAAIAKMVIALGETLGLAVIAEGVETEAQKVFLAHLGCHAYQGYLFSRPLPLDKFELFARKL